MRQDPEVNCLFFEQFAVIIAQKQLSGRRFDMPAGDLQAMHGRIAQMSALFVERNQRQNPPQRQSVDRQKSSRPSSSLAFGAGLKPPP